jgi:hypothetical protein
VQADFDSWQKSGMQRQQKITLGEMRSDNGPRRLIVYCSDFKCSHSVIVDAAPWGDEVRLSDLEPKFTCKACGRRGADVRPLFEKAAMGA